MASLEVVRSRKTVSHLPLLRFTSVVNVLVAMDSLTCIGLWIAGGDSLYLENNVREFSITRSTFDLACIAALRGLIIIASYYYLEQFIITRNSTSSLEKQLKSSRMSFFCQAAILITSLLSLGYSLVKGGLLIRMIWKKEAIVMHITYKILCIASVAFSVVELIFGGVSSWCVRRVVRERGLRLLINQDLDDEKPAKKKADLRRLIFLAKPVREILCTIIQIGLFKFYLLPF